MTVRHFLCFLLALSSPGFASPLLSGKTSVFAGHESLSLGEVKKLGAFPIEGQPTECTDAFHGNWEGVCWGSRYSVPGGAKDMIPLSAFNLDEMRFWKEIQDEGFDPDPAKASRRYPLEVAQEGCGNIKFHTHFPPTASTSVHLVRAFEDLGALSIFSQFERWKRTASSPDGAPWTRVFDMIYHDTIRATWSKGGGVLNLYEEIVGRDGGSGAWEAYGEKMRVKMWNRWLRVERIALGANHYGQYGPPGAPRLTSESVNNGLICLFQRR